MLPVDAHPLERYANGFIADQAFRQLGFKTDLRDQSQCPSRTRFLGLAGRTMEQGFQPLTLRLIKDRSDALWARRFLRQTL